jgi:hypothetical protein
LQWRIIRWLDFYLSPSDLAPEHRTSSTISLIVTVHTGAQSVSHVGEFIRYALSTRIWELAILQVGYLIARRTGDHIKLGYDFELPTGHSRLIDDTEGRRKLDSQRARNCSMQPASPAMRNL